MIVLTDRTLGDEGRKIFVNEALIEVIRPHADSGGSTLQMSSGNLVLAREDVAQVRGDVFRASGFIIENAEAA